MVHQSICNAFNSWKMTSFRWKKNPSQLTSSESSTPQLSSSICKRNNLFIFKFMKFFAISTEDGCMISKWHADCRPWPTIKSQTMVFCYQNCSELPWEKNVLVIEKNFWNSRLKTENLQSFWDHKNNLFKQWKVKIIFGNRMLF